MVNTVFSQNVEHLVGMKRIDWRLKKEEFERRLQLKLESSIKPNPETESLQSIVPLFVIKGRTAWVRGEEGGSGDFVESETQGDTRELESKDQQSI